MSHDRNDTGGQMTLFPVANQGLFSNNYIKKHLPTSPAWTQFDAKLDAVLAGVKDAYRAAAELNLGPGEEDQLRETLISPILKLLGFEYAVEPGSRRGGVQNRPDYALFLSHDELVAARQGKSDVHTYYSHAITILEAKYWGRRLNDADSADKLDSRDPTAQATGYLDDVYRASNGKVQWAILTNGKLWRLFYHHSDFRAGTYYEVDLEEVVRRGDIADFKRFYLFFSRDAFIPDPQTGKSLLDAHRKGSVEYASAISNRLKELIFDEVFEGLAQGFLEYRRAEKGITAETEKSLAELHDSCMILLYRLIFLLFAESRNLLPVDLPGYRAKSLFRLREDVTRDLASTPFEKMSSRAYDYWSRFESLCNIIAKGDPSLNVPIYNGGLFEQTPDSFLATHKLADRFFARALHALTRDHGSKGERQRVKGEIRDFSLLPHPLSLPSSQGSEPSYYDYSSLSVRHLGDVYEGLLEFFVRVADQPMAEVKEKGKVVWTPATSVAAGAKVVGERKPGEMYIENSNHERKVTGSYFTPPYIVEYIVKHAVGPVLHERLKQARVLLTDLKVLYGRQRHALRVGREWRHWEHPGDAKSKHMPEIQAKEEQLFETLFGIKALDLSMGSGHFLVRTVNAISDTLISFLARFDENPVIARIDQMRQQIISDVERQGVKIDVTRLTEVNLIKRMVMKRCIYGVDLNPMAVELAKLSLWLDSFTLGAPLSFLDHHLKCGNSLIGKDDISTAIVPGSPAAQQFQAALRSASMISRMSDTTASEVAESRKLYKTMQDILAPFKRRFNYVLAREFTEMRSNISPDRIAGAIQSGSYDYIPESARATAEADVRLANEIADKYHFFHWRLEFPEIWYDENGEKGSPGFNAVVGNPPYIDSEGMTRDSGRLRELIQATYTMTKGNWDIYIAFFEAGFRFLGAAGVLSFVTPDKWISKPFGDEMRIRTTDKILSILRVGRSVFESSNVDAIVSVFTKTPQPLLHIYDYENDGITLKRVVNKEMLRPPYAYDWLFSNHFGFLVKIDAASERLSKYGECENACATSDAYKLQEFIEEQSKTRGSKDYLRVINTGTIGKYASRWGHREMVYLGSKYRRPVVNKKQFLAAFPNSYGRKAVKPKLIIKGLNLLDACIDSDGTIIPGKTTLLITSDSLENLRLLLSIINSSVAFFYLKEKYPASSYNQGTTFTKEMINGLPVPAIPAKDRDVLVGIVDRIVAAKRANPTADTSRFQREINKRIYSLYGLTDEEIRIVEEE